MTALLNLTRLREIADVTEHPNLASRRMIPRLAWTVDSQTGRPSSQWVLGEKDTQQGRV
jgi:hypothetical protein